LNGLNNKQIKFISFMRKFPAKDEIIGGREIRPYELFTNLAKFGYCSEIYTIHSRHDCSHRHGKINIQTVLNPVQNTYLKYILMSFLVVNYLIRFRRSNKGKLCCIVQVPALLTFPVIGSIVIACRLLNIEMWALVHDLSLEQIHFNLRRIEYNYLLSRKRKWMIMMIGYSSFLEEIILLKRASFIAAHSEGIKNYMVAKYGLSSNKIIVLRASVNPETIQRLSVIDKKELTTVMFLGSLGDADVGLLVEAVKRARFENERINLKIVGMGDVDAFTKKYGKYNWITYEPRAKYYDFSKVVKDADILAIPYLKDPYLDLVWQLKVPMYLASGRPTIITETREIIEYLKDEKICLICPPDPDKMAKSIVKLIKNPELARQLAKRARDFVLNKLTWEITIRKVINALAYALNHNNIVVELN